MRESKYGYITYLPNPEWHSNGGNNNVGFGWTREEAEADSGYWSSAPTVTVPANRAPRWAQEAAAENEANEKFIVRSEKLEIALRVYGGFRGHQTLKAILESIPADLFDRLTGQELGLVMQAVHTAYHSARRLPHGITLEDDCLWVPSKDGKDGRLIEIEALRINREEQAQ